MTVAGLVLAAGEGRRFGGPKAPFEVGGERLVDRSVRVLDSGGCSPVLVVLGAWIGAVEGAEVVVNPDWATGMASSLVAGLGSLVDPEIDAAVVTLVDLPGLTPEAVARVVACSDDLAAATYNGVRGHPVLLRRSHWAGVCETARGDRGARSYLDEHSVTLVEVGDVADGADLDER